MISFHSKGGTKASLKKRAIKFLISYSVANKLSAPLEKRYFLMRVADVFVVDTSGCIILGVFINEATGLSLYLNSPFTTIVFKEMITYCKVKPAICCNIDIN